MYYDRYKGSWCFLWEEFSLGGEGQQGMTFLLLRRLCVCFARVRAEF
jgi:hypothetical protein